jgi:cytochrome b561
MIIKTWYKTTGFLVLAVMWVRGLWRMANPPPAPPAGTRPWERRLALALHRGFYILIAAMIASGWVMVSASPLPLPAHLPGGFLVPNLTCRACAIQASEGASMCAIPFGVNVNESGQIGAGLALETRYRTID